MKAATRLKRVAPNWIRVFPIRSEAAFAKHNAFAPDREFDLT